MHTQTKIIDTNAFLVVNIPLHKPVQLESKVGEADFLHIHTGMQINAFTATFRWIRSQGHDFDA